MLRFIPLLLVLFAVGCGPTTRTYSVTVTNQSLEPMTVWLTKDGPPSEMAWASPEQIAIAGIEKDIPFPGVVVPAGKTGVMPGVEGKFDSRTHAILRVYRGQMRLNEILSVSDGSTLRTDVRLTPGDNTITITPQGKPVLGSRE